MTAVAGRHPGLRKLRAMHICVACFALCGRSLEIDVDEAGTGILWFMAIDALRSRVSAAQGKGRLGMVEVGEIFPRLGRVTKLASQWFSIRSRLPHEPGESPAVRVGVATGTSQVRPVIDRGRLRFEIREHLMAIAARNRHMTPTQREGRFVVPPQAECGWQKAFQAVAALAGVEVRRSGKLPGVLIAVAVSAALELHPEQRVFSLGNMTLPALQGGMLTLQGIRGRRVLV